MPPADFEVFYEAINYDNVNKCETLSGILYCNENIFHQTYKNITLVLNENILITIHPRYFMEYDFEMHAWMIKVAAQEESRSLGAWSTFPVAVLLDLRLRKRFNRPLNSSK